MRPVHPDGHHRVELTAVGWSASTMRFLSENVIDPSGASRPSYGRQRPVRRSQVDLLVGLGQLGLMPDGTTAS
jgi:hypothetical protein